MVYEDYQPCSSLEFHARMLARVARGRQLADRGHRLQGRDEAGQLPAAVRTYTTTKQSHTKSDSVRGTSIRWYVHIHGMS